MVITPIVIAMLWLSCGSSQSPLALTSVSRFDFEGGGSADPARVAEGLSGIAYVGDDDYLLVSDQHAFLHRLTIIVDRATGEVVSAVFGTPIELKDDECRAFIAPAAGPDREALTYEPAARAVWVANERTGTDQGRPSISQYSLDTGCKIREISTESHPQLEVFSHIRPNLGFESLARIPRSEGLWAANEEALAIDGPPSTETEGSLVRLQQLDRHGRPIAQYVYATDRLPGPRSRARGGLFASGVAELLVLTDGTLLALERAIAGTPLDATARIRIYRVGVEDAVPLARPGDGLHNRPVTPVPKTLLLELGPFTFISNSNFEAFTVGPRLTNGDYSVLLVADNGRGTRQSIFALRLSGLRD